jgi:hypothetical protein
VINRSYRRRGGRGWAENNLHGFSVQELQVHQALSQLGPGGSNRRSFAGVCGDLLAGADDLELLSLVAEVLAHCSHQVVHCVVAVTKWKKQGVVQ